MVFEVEQVVFNFVSLNEINEQDLLIFNVFSVENKVGFSIYVVGIFEFKEEHEYLFILKKTIIFSLIYLKENIIYFFIITFVNVQIIKIVKKMILNPLTNIRPRIMSARIEHSKLFRLERPKPHKIVLNEQIHNTQIVSLMNKLNIKKSNDNVNSKAILNEKASSFKKTNIKLPKLNRINEQNNIKTDNKENNVLKFNNCYGSPVLWMKKSNLKKLKSNTDSKVSPSLLKTLVHVNKFSNFCAINPKVCLPREKESKQNFEIDEQIVNYNIYLFNIGYEWKFYSSSFIFRIFFHK